MITIYTIDKKKNRKVLVGYYFPKDCRFVKKVKNNHYMIKEKGYGIQYGVMKDLKEYGCKEIYIFSATKKYKCSFWKWCYKGTVKDYGHGKQYFLPVKEMTVW